MEEKPLAAVGFFETRRMGRPTKKIKTPLPRRPRPNRLVRTVPFASPRIAEPSLRVVAMDVGGGLFSAMKAGNVIRRSTRLFGLAVSLERAGEMDRPKP